MTVSDHVAGLLEHPFLKHSVKGYVAGYDKDLKHFLSVIIVHTHQMVRQDCVRKYRTNKWANIPEIITELTAVPFPEKIKYELPIPEIIEEIIATQSECMVVPLKVVKNHRHTTIYFNPNQLELFGLSKASRILQEA